MSELKVYRFLGQDEVWPDANLGSDYYLKSEADKVISELKEGAKNLILDNYLKDREIKHHKYKRCLAMADNCEKEAMVVCYNVPRIKWLGKWKLRWLELAKKFKEAR